MTAAPAARRGIPGATVARLPVYLRALAGLAAKGVDTVSSEELAESAGVRSAKLRKDLSYLGSYGVRGVGYDVVRLREEIARELGLQHDWSVAIIGMGNLGHALAAYSGFATRGFRVTWLVDEDPAIVGQTIAGLTVISFDELAAEPPGGLIGVIATPPTAAQAVADRLVTMGVHSILNFAPCVLNVPEGVEIRKVDLATELQILAFHEQHAREDADPIDGGLQEATS
ncbi:redox-sensing transcriptional repressor Rex [Luteipulveratus mongoliensis]|uniref:Redox-sensing transcriptional repressor Rex n=1 Tax=Luteipulveratus mongoliensis TaxID=571913 RepID=A0A0K1JMP6_9MICO|nr:redox-sensing transcriptional repressor Rex [Luteipulveratus mongoliensis]AKU17992.1 REX family transcriptional regulator [Luteipulveratus mongoliensis]